MKIRNIWKWFMDRLLPPMVPLDESVVRQENRLGIHLLAMASLPLNVVVMFAQLVVSGINTALFRSLWLIGYAAWMLFLDKVILPDDYENSKPLLYCLEAPLFIIAILLGTVWDPTHQANTILLFLLANPVFLFDRMERITIYEGCWTLCFLAVNAFVKEPALQLVDGVHVLEFLLASTLIMDVVMRIRYTSLKHLKNAEFQLEHNSQTECLNQNALHRKQESYLGIPLVLVFADMDQLKFYNDFYGHAEGNRMLLYTIKTLQEYFGAENTYHYGGDEALCLLPQAAATKAQERIKLCIEKLMAFTYSGHPLPLSCTFGYVEGTAHTVSQLEQMIHLANIYSHKAKQSRNTKMIGGPFHEEALQEGILETNVSARARSYEINQLTGLPGMSYFVARSNELLHYGVDHSNKPMVGYFQIMQMRDFNNEYGYAQGDALIAYTGKLLQRSFAFRLVCHITGGQFCLLCYESEVAPGLEQVNEVLRNYKPGFHVYSKVGFSAYREATDAITLLDEARMAMKSIKESKTQFFRAYDQELENQIRFRQYILNHLDEAIEKGHLAVYYQPIVRASTGLVCNEEALSRWEDPEKGFLLPYQFIPVLEENGLMYKLSLHVVRQVLKDFQVRKKEGTPIVPISINLSRKDFDQCDMVQEISSLVTESGFSPDILKIEITESAFVSDLDQLKSAVEGFRKKGFEVWLDDFGSEYSTLNLLQDLSFDLIKIDMQFMRQFSESSKNYLIISHIIEMSKGMGITTLVEGIETKEHYRILKSIGCDKMQGFLFNRPNSLDYIIQRAKSGTGLSFEKEAEVPEGEVPEWEL